MCGDRLALGDQGVDRLSRRDADQPHRAARMRAAADRDKVGVVGDEADFSERDLQPVADQLRKARLVPLPAAHGADDQLDRAVGADRQLGAFARDAAGHFDVICDADAAAQAARFRCRLARRKFVPVGRVERVIHAGGIVAAVVCHADAVGERHRVRRDQVAPAQFYPVEAMLRGGQIDQPLDHVDRFRPPGAAVDGGRRGVGQHRVAFEMNGGNAVDALHHRQPLAQRPEIDRVGAEIERVDAAQAEEIALFVERQFRRGGQVARLVVGEKTFLPRGGPFDRPPDPPRRPGHQGEFRREGVAGAEIAAHVAEHGAAILQRHAQG